MKSLANIIVQTPYLWPAVATFILVIGISLGVILAGRAPTFLNPQSSQVLSENTGPVTRLPTSYTVIGFLPYWLIKHAPDTQVHLLTHLAYFGIAIDEQGQIETHLADGTKELGLHRLQTSPELNNLLARSRQAGVQNILVLRAMSTAAIAAAVEPNNRSTLIAQILSYTLEYQFTGLNVDFEPTTETTPQLQQQVTDFVAELSSRCRQSIPNCHMSIDIYANTAFRPRIWDIPRLANHLDHVIVMGYDFYRPSSPNAGPNAPIHGAPLRWDYDLNTSIAKLTTLMPSTQITLAVPYYGYEWQTISDQPNSTAIRSTGRLATYSRIHDILNTCFEEYPVCTRRVDPDSLSPYLVYQVDDKWFQIWYDDATSLRHKYQFIKSANLGGTAIWALGYDAPRPDLWNLLQEQFFTPLQ